MKALCLKALILHKQCSIVSPADWCSPSLHLLLFWSCSKDLYVDWLLVLMFSLLSLEGAGFAAFGQAKPVVTPFGQVAAVGVSSNPFMVSELLHDINNFCMSEDT